MRFGASRSLVALLWASLPAAAVAAPLPSSEIEPEPLSVEVEHAALSVEGVEEEPPTRQPGRPRVVSIAATSASPPLGPASPSGFDCSGSVLYVYGRVGVRYRTTVRSSGAWAASFPAIASRPVTSSSSTASGTSGSTSAADDRALAALGQAWRRSRGSPTGGTARPTSAPAATASRAAPRRGRASG